MQTRLVMATVPPPAELEPYRDAVGEKDAHVLAAAVSAAAAYLITLDRPLRDRVNQAGFAVEALTPGDFIQTRLIHHEDYPALRG